MEIEFNVLQIEQSGANLENGAEDSHNNCQNIDSTEQQIFNLNFHWIKIIFMSFHEN